MLSILWRDWDEAGIMIDLAVAVNCRTAPDVQAAPLAEEWGGGAVKECKVINFTNI